MENQQKDSTKVASEALDSNWQQSSKNQQKDVKNVTGVVVDSFIGLEMWKTSKKVWQKLHHLLLESNWLRRLEK